jgi:putative glutamine amidotransferase
MTRPRIGLSLDTGALDEGKKLYELNVDYANAVIRAGGMPVPLPHTHDHALRVEMIESLDGLIIPGGSDIDPALFGQPRHTKSKLVDPDRQAFDLAMLSLAEQRHLPTLGICLGCQLMNVHRRGTLHQHLPDADLGTGAAALEHSRAGDRTNYHTVTIRAGTRLADILAADNIQANSRHHQGIAKVGHGLIASAAAPDGLVEAIEDPTLPMWLAVQWHPENLGGTMHDKLFETLIKQAQKRR